MAKSKNPFLDVVRQIFPRKTSLAVLQYGMVKNNFLCVTDLETRLEIATHLLSDTKVDAGMYYLPMLIASKGDWDAAKQAAGETSSDDFPGAWKAETGDRQFPIPVDLMMELDAARVGAAVLTELSRMSLQHIHFNPIEGVAEATDGHVLLRTKLKTAFKKDFCIKPKDLSLIHTLSTFGTPYRVTVFESYDEKKIVKRRWMRVDSTGYVLTMRLDDGMYPDIVKVLPKHDKEQNVTWSEGQTHTTRQALKAFEPFVSEETELVRLGQDGLYSINRETKICKRWQYAEPVCVLPKVTVKEDEKTREVQLVHKGANRERLLDILSFMDAPLIFNAGRTAIDGMVFRNNTSGRYALLMPLRLVDDDSDGACADVKYTDLKVLP